MTSYDEQRAEAAALLQNALTTIRELTVFRERGPHELSSEARIMAGYLADAVHNLPHFIIGVGDSGTYPVSDVERAKQIIAEAKAMRPDQRRQLVKRAAKGRSPLLFWRRD